MAIDKELLLARIHEMLAFVEELKGLSKISNEDFVKNRERQYAVMHLLQLAIEGAISVGNHIVSRKRLGVPENYQDIFTLLERDGTLPAEFAAEMMKMARFRNRLVHMYWQVDLRQIYEIITTKLDDFEKYAEYVKSPLSQPDSSPPR